MPIVLDTDIGSDPDDVIALAMVLDHPEIFDLRAIVATGKEPQARAEFARLLCTLAGREDVKIAVGCDTPLSKAPSRFHVEQFHRIARGAGTAGKFLDLDDLIGMLSPDITLVTIGPWSTLSALLQKDATAIKDLRRTFSMGGFVSRTKPEFKKEYNLGIDYQASRLVLDTAFRHVCVTKNACQDVSLGGHRGEVNPHHHLGWKSSAAI